MEIQIIEVLVYLLLWVNLEDVNIHRDKVSDITDMFPNRVYIMEGPIMKARHNNFHDVSER